MKRLNNSLIAIAAMAVVPTVMPAQAPECQGLTFNQKAVALATPRGGSLVNFAGSGGQLDPVPLLETSFTVVGFPGRPVCVTLTFSAQVDPGDNYGVYQASIDNVPMSGHALLSEFPFGQTTPVIFDAVNQVTYLTLDGYRFLNSANSRFVSYTFLASVMPGTHTMRIRVAGCCSPVPVGNSPVFVRAATASLRW